MREVFTTISLFFLIAFALNSQQIFAQQPSKIIAECTITYSVNIAGNDKKETTKKLYIKGRKTRSEISNTSFFQATIYDNKTGDATVLKEVGNDKYLSQFNTEKWKEKNSRWNDATVTTSNETKKILNYSCRKATITTKDGSSFVIFFTTDFTASATENPYQFKNIPGLILEYESQTSEGKNVEFTAVAIDLNPVPAAKFTVPVSGYRIM